MTVARIATRMSTSRNATAETFDIEVSTGCSRGKMPFEYHRSTAAADVGARAATTAAATSAA
jgi:hypothetical protein